MGEERIKGQMKHRPGARRGGTLLYILIALTVLVVAVVLLFCFYAPARRPFVDTFGYGLIPLVFFILVVLWFILRNRIRQLFAKLHIPAFLQGLRIAKHNFCFLLCQTCTQCDFPRHLLMDKVMGGMAIAI